MLWWALRPLMESILIKLWCFVTPQPSTFSEMAVRESLMAFGEHSRLSESRVFFFFFLVNVFDVIDSPHTHCSTFAATPKPPVPKATLMETQRAETKQDLSQSDLVWPFWSNTLIWHDVNKVTNHGFCTHCLFLDLKLSETVRWRYRAADLMISGSPPHTQFQSCLHFLP